MQQPLKKLLKYILSFWDDKRDYKHLAKTNLFLLILEFFKQFIIISILFKIGETIFNYFIR